jgi:hypothetical protein
LAPKGREVTQAFIPPLEIWVKIEIEEKETKMQNINSKNLNYYERNVLLS